MLEFIILAFRIPEGSSMPRSVVTVSLVEPIWQFPMKHTL